MTAPADGGQMSLVDHLTELRSRLIKCALAVAVGATVCWIFYFEILDFLLEPYCAQNEGQVDASVFGDGCQLLVTDPLQPFSVRLTIAGYGGLALAVPVLLWQLWRFIAPGLYKHEKRYAIPFVIGGAVLFFLGAGLAYWSLPRALEFLADIGGPDLVTGFSARPLPGVRRQDDRGVRRRVRVPHHPDLPPADGHRLDRHAAPGPPVRAGGHRGARGRDHAERGSLHPARAAVPMYVFYELAILYGVVRTRRARRRENASGTS